MSFHGRSTALEVVDGLDLTGLNAIVTGGASGIGVETVRALTSAGAHVTIAARDTGAAQAVADAIDPTFIDLLKLDLSSVTAARAAGESWAQSGRSLHLLINNAGVMACPFARTIDGFEMQVGTNHFGHFAFTMALIDRLKAGADDRGRPARVVQLSSIGHRRSDILWDDMHYRTRVYDKWEAYGQSKTANALFALELARRFAGDGIAAYAVMPGGIMTPLQRHMSEEEKLALGWILPDGSTHPVMKTPEQGASTSVWAATAPELVDHAGAYLEDCSIAKDWNPDAPWFGAKPHIRDAASAVRLWDVTEETLRA